MKTNISDKTPHLTKLQRSNLATLALYLRGLKPSKHFNMSDWARHNGRAVPPAKFIKLQQTCECGTAGCAAGHGPIAGIRPKRGEEWQHYVIRCFGADNCTWGVDQERAVYLTCFDTSWENDPKEAAKRIAWLLLTGKHLSPSGDVLPQNFRPNWKLIASLITSKHSLAPKQ